MNRIFLAPLWIQYQWMKLTFSLYPPILSNIGCKKSASSTDFVRTKSSVGSRWLQWFSWCWNSLSSRFKRTTRPAGCLCPQTLGLCHHPVVEGTQQGQSLGRTAPSKQTWTARPSSMKMTRKWLSQSSSRWGGLAYAPTQYFGILSLHNIHYLLNSKISCVYNFTDSSNSFIYLLLPSHIFCHMPLKVALISGGFVKEFYDQFRYYHLVALGCWWPLKLQFPKKSSCPRFLSIFNYPELRATDQRYGIEEVIRSWSLTFWKVAIQMNFLSSCSSDLRLKILNGEMLM